MLYIHNPGISTFGFITTDLECIKYNTGNLEMLAPASIEYTDMISGYHERFLGGIRFTTAYLYQVKEVYKDKVIVNGHTVNLHGDMEVLNERIV